MNRFAMAAALVAALAGSASAAGTDCNVNVEEPWTQAGAGWRVQAMTNGPSCGRAIVVLVIRDEQDVPLWTDTMTTMNLELLGLADTPRDMKNALSTWIGQGGSDLKTASSLPEWPEGEPSPVNTGAIVIEAEPSLDQIDWEALRKQDTPLYCYDTGIARSTCVAKEPIIKNVIRIGTRIYPDPDGE
jgi:hypothetical protein